jgi:hypothetical protein
MTHLSLLKGLCSVHPKALNIDSLGGQGIESAPYSMPKGGLFVGLGTNAP